MYVIAILSSLCFGSGPLCLRAVTAAHYPTFEQCLEAVRDLKMLYTLKPHDGHALAFRCVLENQALPFKPYANDPKQR